MTHARWSWLRWETEASVAPHAGQDAAIPSEAANELLADGTE
jgi:hypothetical protein